MKRRTANFSYDESEQIWFDKVHREAAKQKPRVSKSAMLIHIIRSYFEAQADLKRFTQSRSK